jgi:hypothetical protein
MMTYLIAASALFVSFKGILLYLQGEKAEELFDAGNFWVLGPCILLLWSFAKLGPELRRRSPMQNVILFWMLVLSIHAFYNFSFYGIALAILSVLPWGVWTALGMWGTLEKKVRLDKYVAFLILTIAIGYGLSVLYEFTTGDILLRASNRVVGQDFFRYSGLSGSPVSTGLTLTCGLFTAIWVWISVPRNSVRWISMVGAGIIIASSILCLGRLALVCGIFGVAVLAKTLFKQSMGLIFVGALSLFIALFSVGQFLTDNGSKDYLLQAFSLSEGGNTERLRVYQEQFDIITQTTGTLLIGTGSGSTGAVAIRTQGDEETTESSAVRLIREFGLIGSIPFLAVIAVTALSLWKSLGRADQKTSGIVFLTLFSVVILESCFAEALDGWVNSFFFWSCVCVAGFLDRQRRDAIVQKTASVSGEPVVVQRAMNPAPAR